MPRLVLCPPHIHLPPMTMLLPSNFAPTRTWPRSLAVSERSNCVRMIFSSALAIEIAAANAAKVSMFVFIVIP